MNMRLSSEGVNLHVLPIYFLPNVHHQYYVYFWYLQSWVRNELVMFIFSFVFHVYNLMNERQII